MSERQSASRVLTAMDKNTILEAAVRMKMNELCGSDKHVHLNYWRAAEINNLSEEVYDVLVPKELQRKLKKLPDGVLPMKTYFVVYREAEDEDLDPEDATYYEFTLATARPMPHFLETRRQRLSSKSPVWKKLRLVQKSYRAHERILRQLEQELRQFLSATRTVRQLKDRWPEVSKIPNIPLEVLDETPRTAIIVMPTNVNTILGLTK